MATIEDLWRNHQLGEGWIATGSRRLTAGESYIFAWYPGPLSEGVLMGLGFYLSSEDYRTSPVSVVRIALDTILNDATALGDPVPGMTFTVPVSNDGSLVYMPDGWGVKIREGETIGLQVTNNEDGTGENYMYAEGRLAGVKWSRGARQSALGPDPGGVFDQPPGQARAAGGIFCT